MPGPNGVPIWGPNPGNKVPPSFKEKAKSRTDQMFSWMRHKAELFRRLGTAVSDSVGFGCRLKMCISDKFPGGASTAVPGRHLENHCLRIQ